jgi:peptidoglycan-associated lipoprotein
MTRRLISPALALLALLPRFASAQDVPPSVRAAAACAPVGSPAPSHAPRVVAPAAVTKGGFVVGEAVAIDRGTDDGVRPGGIYMVRRPMHFRGAPQAQFTIGRLHVTEATSSTATGQIDVVCDGISAGDVLEPFTELALSPDITRTFVGGTVDRQRTIQVSYAGDGRSLFGDRDFILAQGGQDKGVTTGARYAAFRRGSDHDGTPLAEAVVVTVFAGQSLLRVTEARDALFTGDTLALRVGARDPNPPAGRGASQPDTSEPQKQPAAAPEPAAVIAQPPSRAAQPNVTFEDVHFDLDRYHLRPEARASLDAAVKTLQADPTLRVQIEGHTCNIGTSEYNLALGQKRATAVRDYLAAHGIDPARMTTVSYGEEKPAYDNARAETRRLNRRAVLTVNIQR